MARIIVTTDATTHHASATLLDENVYSMHLETEHSSAQLIERLGWAISHAESTQRAQHAR
ncbi:MAG TPA: hypothetical protein VNZ05_06470 [Solirubrobacteraceae bacterium]|jgi:hypothetical protein|nr:hypothetical protein [Solirubrobacteraceae bacterium]